MPLKDVLREKIEAHRPRTTALVKKHGDVKIGEVTIAQAIGGARGVRCLVTDISYLDPEEGIRFRGMTIPEVMEALPRPKGKDFPYVEGFWYLLLTGDIPTEKQALEVVEDFKARSAVPAVRHRSAPDAAAGHPSDDDVLRGHRRHAARVEVREELQGEPTTG